MTDNFFELYPVRTISETTIKKATWESLSADLSFFPEEGKTFGLSYSMYIYNKIASLEPSFGVWRIENGNTCYYELGHVSPKMTTAYAASVVNFLSTASLFEYADDALHNMISDSNGEEYHVIMTRAGLLIVSQDFLSCAYHNGRKTVFSAHTPESKSNHEKTLESRSIEALEEAANALVRFQMPNQDLESHHRVKLTRNRLE